MVTFAYFVFGLALLLVLAMFCCVALCYATLCFWCAWLGFVCKLDVWICLVLFYFVCSSQAHNLYTSGSNYLKLELDNI